MATKICLNTLELAAIYTGICIISYHSFHLKPVDAQATSQETAYFRFNVNLTSLKYQAEFSDSSSLKFKLVDYDVAERVSSFFRDLPGTWTVTLEKLKKSGDGVLATIHLATTEFGDRHVIEKRIRDAVARKGFLGHTQTSGEGFKFQTADSPANKTTKWDCEPDSFWCGDGGCVPPTEVCDSIVDCDDSSDEDKCEPTLVEMDAYPKNLIVQAGQTAEFFCGSSDFYHFVRWSRNEEDVDVSKPANMLHKHGRLLIVNPTKADDGEYICTAERSLPGSQVTVTLTVIPQTDSTRNGESGVSVYNASEGSPVKLPCSLEPSGDTVNWTKIAGRLPQGSSISSDNVLNISIFQEEDAGFYECRLNGINGSIGEVHSVLKLVAVAPQLSGPARRRKQIPRVTPSYLTVTEGDPYAFFCTSTKPGFKVEWTRSRARMPSTVRRMFGNLTSSTSKLTDVGRYYCRHRGAHVSERMTVRLNVLPRPRYPTVTPVNLTVIEGEPFRFLCETGRDGINVEWSRQDGEEMPKNSTVTNGDFVSHFASLNETGEYNCRHSGFTGETVAVHLTVVERPRFPTVTPTNLTVNEGEPFQFRCNSSRTGVPVEWSREGGHYVSEDTVMVGGNFGSNSASVSDSGEYACSHDGRPDETTVIQLTVSVGISNETDSAVNLPTVALKPMKSEVSFRAPLPVMGVDQVHPSLPEETHPFSPENVTSTESVPAEPVSLRDAAMKSFESFAAAREEEIKADRVKEDQLIGQQREGEDKVRDDRRKAEDRLREEQMAQILLFLNQNSG